LQRASVFNEQRRNEIIGCDQRFARHAAQSRPRAQTAQAVNGKGHDLIFDC
jgi:hypothetical protein